MSLTDEELMERIKHRDIVKSVNEITDYIDKLYVFKELQELRKPKESFKRAVFFISPKDKDKLELLSKGDFDAKFLGLEKVDGETIPYFKIIKFGDD